MSTAEASEREELAAQQAALMRALSRQGPPPEGFDAAQVDASAASLLNKRVRAAARAWPALARGLGESFAARFRDFARQTPLPAEGGPLADGRAFAASCYAELADEARQEVLGVDLRYRRRADELLPRRGPCLRAAWLPGARRIVLAVRLPWLGVHWLSLPLPKRR